MAEQHLDSGGNPQVDFVWGNMPMQPNYGRTDSGNWFGGGYMQGDNGWDSAYSQTSDTLNTAYTVWLANGWLSSEVGTNHTMVYQGWANFPEFLPNYAGDGDADLETTVPKIVGLSRYAAVDALEKAYLDYEWEWVNIYAGGMTAVSGSDTRVYVDNNGFLDGLKVGDSLRFDWYDGSNEYSKQVTVKSIRPNDESNILVISISDLSDYNYDGGIEGTFYAGSEDTYTRVVGVDTPPNAGDIVNEGTGIYFYVLND